MLLADDYKPDGHPARMKGQNKQDKQAQLLSEIAEEDDLSSVSESLRQPGTIMSGNKAASRLHGSFSNQSKASIQSHNITARKESDVQPLDVKRHSQLVQPHEQIDEHNIEIQDPQLIPPPQWQKHGQPTSS